MFIDRTVGISELSDYISDDTLATNSQVVRFGVNLLDFSKDIDMSELATVIVPRGNRLDIDETDSRYIEGLEPYLTVEELGEKQEEGQVWHDNKSMFVKNPTAVSNFGWVCSVVDWPNVTNADTLYSKAVKYLKDEQYEKMTLEIQALDLKYLTNSETPIKFQSKLRCVSEPHNMDHTFIVSKMQIDLSNPANSLYTLGSDVKLTLTQASSKVDSDVQSQIESLPSKHEILIAAQRNAYQMISGMGGNSYVHLIPAKNPLTGKSNGIQRIEVTDGPTYDPDADNDDDPSTDPFPDSLNRWIWTVGGLGHIGRSTYQKTWASIGSMNVAMQMTGEIVADRITVGVLKAINKYYEINTKTGHIKMLDAQIGPWYLDYGGEGLTNRHDSWVGPDRIACGNYGATHIAMRGSSSGNSGYLEVGINRNSDYIHMFTNYIERNRTGYNDDYAKWDEGSDERLKEDIKDLTLEEALKIVENTQALTFRYKKNNKVKHYGVTAQRMEKECEDLGLENPFVKDLNYEYKTVDYDQFIIPLLKVVQAQQKAIEELQNKEKNNG